MSDSHKPRLSDAIPHAEFHGPADHSGKPYPNHETVAEMAREAHEVHEAVNDQPTIREKMVEMGRGNQQAGRQGQ